MQCANLSPRFYLSNARLQELGDGHSKLLAPQSCAEMMQAHCGIYILWNQIRKSEMIVLFT